MTTTTMIASAAAQNCSLVCAPPVGQRGLGLGGRNDQDRKMHQRANRTDLVLILRRAGETSRDVAVQGERPLK